MSLAVDRLIVAREQIDKARAAKWVAVWRAISIR
jgi:hypothetical protein